MPQAIDGTEGKDLLKRYHKRPIVFQVNVKQQNPTTVEKATKPGTECKSLVQSFAELADYPPIDKAGPGACQWPGRYHASPNVPAPAVLGI